MRILPHSSRSRLVGTSTLATLLILASSLNAQTFDPKSVQSSSCNDVGFNCGYVPPTPEEARAVPGAPAPSVKMRGLPANADLSTRMPPPGNQGQQNSCVAWASAYALKSYHEQAERNWGYDPPFAGGGGQHVFSPAYVYNQINGGQDRGSNIQNALNLFVTQGAAPWQAMPYSSKDYRTQPSQAARNVAANYKAKGYYQIPFSDLNRIKQELATGNPLVFGMPIDDAFYKVKGATVYDQQGGAQHGGHAMTIVGYDDNKKSPRGDSGAFKILNSWGTDWGDRGYGWVSYRMWLALSPHVLGLTDLKESPPIVQEDPSIRAPAQVTATAGTYPDKVVVTWSAVKGAGAYSIHRANPSNPSSFEEIGNSESNNYSDADVQNEIAYRYRVVAISDEAESEISDSPTAEGFARKQATATTTATAKPGKVVELKSSVDSAGSKVQLSWATLPGAQSFQVISYDPSTKKWNNVTTTRQTTAVDSSPREENRYAVRGINASGAGAWSDVLKVEVSAPADEVTGAPENLTATDGDFKNKIVLTWDRISGARGYEVYRYNEEEEWDGPFNTTSNKFEDTSEAARSGEETYYAVRAISGAGAGEFAEPVAGKSNPNAERAGGVMAPPKNVKAEVNQTSKTITIKWDAVKGATEYYVFRKKKGDKDYAPAKTVVATQFSEPLPGKPGDVTFYVVRSKSELSAESSNSAAVAGFIKQERVAATHRFMPGMGLEEFSGDWKGSYWDGRSAPKQVLVKVSGDGQKFSGTLQVGADAPKQFSGSFVSGARSLDADGLTLRLLPLGVMQLEVNSPKLSATELDLSLERVK